MPTTRPKRNKTTVPTMHVQAFRLPGELVRRLDAHAERMRRAEPGRTATRADALRVLLERALADVEREEESHGR